MTDDEHKRALVRPHRRLAGSTQIAAAQQEGCGSIYVVGQDVDDWPDYAAQVDDGDVCAVYRLVLLVSPDLPARQRRAELIEAVRQIEDAGGIVLELETGRKSSSRDERDDMIADAWEAITSGHLVPKRGKTLGRPRKTITDDDWAAAEQLWWDRRLETWDAVGERLPDGITPHDCWRKFGKRK